MPDPWTALQSATAVISLATVTINEVLQYTNRIRHAPEFSEDGLLKLQQAQRVLDNAEDTLNLYTEDAQRAQLQPTWLDRNLKEPAKAIRDLSQELLVYIEPSANGQLSLRDRMRLVSRHNYVARRVAHLDVHCNIIHGALLTLNLRVTLTRGEDIRGGLEELEAQVATQFERRARVRCSLLTNSQPDPQIEQDDTRQTLLHIERQKDEQTLRVFDEWLDGVQTVCDELSSQYGTGGTPRSRRLQEADNPTPPPIHRLRNLLGRHNEQARLHWRQRNWQKAEFHFVWALQYYNQCKEQQCMRLQQLFDLTDNLAKVQRAQSDWPSSIRESARFLDLISSNDIQNYSERPNEEFRQGLRTRCLLTLASTYFARYEREDQSRNDLEEAQRLAEEARNTLDDYTGGDDRSDADVEHVCSCLRLLISIYNLLGNTVEAQETREALHEASNTLTARNAELAELYLSGARSISINEREDVQAPYADADTRKEFMQRIESGQQDSLAAFLRFRNRKDLIEQCENGKTPLILAICTPNVKESIINQLLGPEWRASPNTCVEGGLTALLAAAEQDLPGIARILMSHGADKESQNSRGMNALMRAMVLDHVDFVRTLRGQGARIDIRFKDKSSLLHWAVQNCSATSCSTLLKTDHSNWLVQTRDHRGRTPLHLCADILAPRTDHAKAILKHCPSVANLLVPETPSPRNPGRTALYSVVCEFPETNRVKFARALYRADSSVFNHCRDAKYCSEYEERVLAAQRRGSRSTVATE